MAIINGFVFATTLAVVAMAVFFGHEISRPLAIVSLLSNALTALSDLLRER